MNRIRRFLTAAFLAALVAALCAACGDKGYQSISADKAAELMETEDCLVVDVRTADEYAEEHIPGAILVPSGYINAGKVDDLPDKDQMLLLYCRTGRRAEDSAARLVELGYTNVYEFGGIVDWKGAVEGTLAGD